MPGKHENFVGRRGASPAGPGLAPSSVRHYSDFTIFRVTVNSPAAIGCGLKAVSSSPAAPRP